ncbi:MAG TPA: NAD(P)H-binding protein [Mariniphaga sp.]|nr:NAD(P)H-binding protein [Mariniphaga sp.]
MMNNDKQLLTANVIGATGLVGKHLVRMLLEHPYFKLVRIFVRKDTGITHPKLEQKIMDFNDKNSWARSLTGDVLFSALGTTRKKAGGKDKQYEVDFRYNLNFANKAKENGVGTYVLVSSVGADSGSSLFYSRMKGELDDAVINLKFNKIVILRPSALTGSREETRWSEKLSFPIATFITKFFMKKYRPIEAETVAMAMIKAALAPSVDKTIWTADEIFELSKY